MASIYSQAVTSSAGARRASTRALGMAKMNLLKTKEFELDEQINFDKLAKKAAKKFGRMKTIGSIVGTGLAWATGMGPLMAAITAAGSTAAGGAVGKAKAYDVMKNQKWFNRTQADLQEGMTKQTITSALVSGVMAGAGAKGAEGKVQPPTLAEAGAGGAELTKQNLGKELIKSGKESVGQLDWAKPGAEDLYKTATGGSDLFEGQGAARDLLGMAEKGGGTDLMTERMTTTLQGRWDTQFMAGGKWGKAGEFVGDPIKPTGQVAEGVAKGKFGADFEYKRNPLLFGKDKGLKFTEYEQGISPMDSLNTGSPRFRASLSGDWMKQGGQNIFKAGSSFFDKGSGLKSGLTLMQMLGQSENEPDYPWMRQ